MPLLTHDQVWEVVCGSFFPEAINYVLNEFKTESWICWLFKKGHLVLVLWNGLKVGSLGTNRNRLRATLDDGQWVFH